MSVEHHHLGSFATAAVAAGRAIKVTAASAEEGVVFGDGLPLHGTGDMATRNVKHGQAEDDCENGRSNGNSSNSAIRKIFLGHYRA